jgi:hypothetical protein
MRFSEDNVLAAHINGEHGENICKAIGSFSDSRWPKHCNSCNKAFGSNMSVHHSTGRCRNQTAKPKSNRTRIRNKTFRADTLGSLEIEPAVVECDFANKSVGFFQNLIKDFMYGMKTLYHGNSKMYGNLMAMILRKYNLGDGSKVAAFAALEILPGLVKKLELGGGRVSQILKSFLEAECPVSAILQRAMKERSSRKEFIPKEMSVDDKLKCVEREVKLGDCSKAFRFLSSVDAPYSKPLDDDVQRELLKSLNPIANEYDNLPEVGGEVVPFQLTKEMLTKGMKRLKKTTYAVSGLSDRILRHVLTNNQPLIEELLKFFNEVLKGNIDNDVTQIWSMCRAILIPKAGKLDEWRPICIGDTLYRFLAKVVCASVSPGLAAELVPFQLAIGLKGGAEMGAILAKLAHDTLEYALVSLDVNNAFNSMRRRHMWYGILRYCPNLLPFFKAIYGGRSQLRNSNGDVLCYNETGIRQGDPLALLFYCLGLQEFLHQIDGKVRQICQHESSATFAFADDINIAVPKKHADKIFKVVVDLLNEAGITVNDSKSIVAFAGSGKNFKALGNPIGDDEYVEAFIEERCQKWEGSLKYMSRLRKHTAFKLLHFCANQQPSYLAKVMNWSNVVAMLRKFDDAVDQTIASIAGLPHLPESASKIRGLPQRLSGLGLYKHGDVRGELQSIKAHVKTKAFCIDTDFKHKLEWLSNSSEYVWKASTIEIHLESGTKPIIPKTVTDEFSGKETNLCVPSGKPLNPKVEVNSSNLWPGVEFLLRAERQLWGKLFGTFFVRRQFVEAANFRSFAYDGSSRWLQKCWGLTNSQFQDILRYRMCLSPYKDEFTNRISCKSCKFGYPLLRQYTHPLGCSANAKSTQMKHDSVVSCVTNFLRGVVGNDYDVITDRDLCKISYLDDNGMERDIIADIVIKKKVNSVEFQPILLDVSIADPANPSSINAGSLFTQGAAVEKRDKEKREKYQNALGTNPETFEIVPLCFESTGFPSPANHLFFKTVSERFAGGTNIGISKLLTSIAAKLQLYNARQFEDARYHRLATSALDHRSEGDESESGSLNVLWDAVVECSTSSGSEVENQASSSHRAKKKSKRSSKARVANAAFEADYSTEFEAVAECSTSSGSEVENQGSSSRRTKETRKRSSKAPVSLGVIDAHQSTVVVNLDEASLTPNRQSKSTGVGPRPYNFRSPCPRRLWNE